MFVLGNSDKNLLVDRPRENKYYDESIKIDINDSNNTHAIIASSVKEKTVCLDIGCGAGYTGELLKNEKNCIVYGIEIDKEAIRIVQEKKWYKEIYNFSITDNKSAEYRTFFSDPLQFDYILFADVLEHIEKTGEILYQFSKKLKPNGKILISIPNIAHFDISQNLVNRTFNYNYVGILDNTHLRFFTKSSFYEMINKVNEVYSTSFQIKQIGKTVAIPPEAANYPHLYELLNKDGEICVLQYVYQIENHKKQGVNNPIEKVDYFGMIEQRLNERRKILKDNEKLEMENKLLQKQCKDLESALHISNKNYESIIHSGSWKITYPLRKGMDFIRNIRAHFHR